MNFNKDFFLGLFAGLALGMLVAIGLFNFFIVRTIENTKQEAKEFVTNARELFRAEVKDELEKGRSYFQENTGEIIDNIKERIKDRIESKKDSLAPSK